MPIITANLLLSFMGKNPLLLNLSDDRCLSWQWLAITLGDNKRMRLNITQNTVCLIYSLTLFIGEALANQAPLPVIPAILTKSEKHLIERIKHESSNQKSLENWLDTGLFHTLLGEYKYRGTTTLSEIAELMDDNFFKKDHVLAEKIAKLFVKSSAGYIALNGGLHTLHGLTNFLALNQAVGKTLKIYFIEEGYRLKPSLIPQSHNNYETGIYTEVFSESDADLIVKGFANGSFELTLVNPEIRTKGNKKKTLWPAEALEEALSICSRKFEFQRNYPNAIKNNRLTYCSKTRSFYWSDLFKKDRAAIVQDHELSQLTQKVRKLLDREWLHLQESRKVYVKKQKFLAELYNHPLILDSPKPMNSLDEIIDSHGFELLQELIKKNIISELELDERVERFLMKETNGKLEHFDYSLQSNGGTYCQETKTLRFKYHTKLDKNQIEKIFSCYPEN